MIFDFLKKTSSIWWLIGYFKLEDWWLNNFSEQERNKILETFQPLWWDWKDILIWTKITSTNDNELRFLWTLSNWFLNNEWKEISYKFIEKAEEYINKSYVSVLDKHFFYLEKLKVYYRNRDTDDFALDKAISACIEQINISKQSKEAFLKEYKNSPLPSHSWFEQLAIIEEKRWNYEKAIELSKQALDEWWNWDWEKRIERNEMKLQKSRD